MALAGHGIGRGIDGSEHVEIEEAVVDRGHQRVGHRMRQTHQIGVGTRRIDDDEIEGALDRAHRLHELLELGIFIVGDLHRLAELDAVVHRDFEVETGAAGPRAPVGDVAGKALLAAVEIDGGDALSGLHQGNGNMQRGGGFSRPALLVAQHDDMRRTELTLTRLKQHDSTPTRYLQITRGCTSSEMRDDAFNSLAACL
jgi:hypothetical protein